MNGASIDEIQRVLEDCVQVLIIKAKHSQLSEEIISDILDFLRQNYKKDGFHERASLVPASYKAMLTMLQDFSEFCSTSLYMYLFLICFSHCADLCTYGTEIRYPQCPCGHVYRCQSQDAPQCHMCGRNRTKADHLICLPLIDWLQRQWQMPELAEAMGSWRDRQSKDGIMRVG